MSLQLLISGFYCGPSPSAGLGIAKSLRAAWPDANIIGIDYWDGASGLHSEALTDRLVFPPWDIIDQNAHAQTIKEMSQDRYVLSALDIEVAWLSQNVPQNGKLLLPSQSALKFADKPYNKVGQFLPFKTPSIYVESGDDQALYDFCRNHSWRIWVKGPYHGAHFVSSWRELDRARRNLAKNGSIAHVFYQAHVRGLEESICFSAFEGKLCGAVHMQKRVTTPEGKTWSGKITALSSRQQEVVADAVAKMKWTGGGEFEMIRDEADQYWLMEFNPRFPAWIYGSTLAGINLPALLVEAASGEKPTGKASFTTNEFTRIVTEIPVLEQISLPQVKQPEHGQIEAVGKYGASFGVLETALIGANDSKNSKSSRASQDHTSPIDLADWFNTIDKDAPTPQRVTLEKTINSHFQGAKNLMSLSTSECRFNVAYSIKTCPDQKYMDTAFTSGLMAEAISMAEVEHALSTGWTIENIILNGPAKWWPRTITSHQGLAAVFCDSLDEFERLIQSGRKDKLWGLRLKIPSFNSRFGCELDSYEDLARATALIQKIPADTKLGFHVHMASNLIGKGHWQDAVESAINWAMTLSAQSGKEISMFDMGGGYHPRDFTGIPWAQILDYTKKKIPSMTALTVEPGRALSQDTMLMVTTIQDIRRKNGCITEIVVDTCISELPLARVYPHRMYLIGREDVKPLDQGKARILGRVCMEDDILAEGVSLPISTKIGDRIIIADAGAYERSMSYEFGYGRVSQAF
ncbi:MAG: hypothetical protein NT027_08590 [Proteobacteria bacterium]|nr:hypothetical protein [Pseudomonadota bacterium]